jgi:hypothetical protein
MTDKGYERRVERRDILSSITWAIILIWAGLAFLAVNSGWLDRLISHSFMPRYLPDNMVIFEPAVWEIIILGAGVILLVEVVIRLMVPSLRRHVIGTLVPGVIFIGIGLGNFIGWDLIGPFILIALGISVLIVGLLRAR